MSKKTIARISSLAHMILALILVDLVPTILGRILLLVCIGVISGVQSICINNSQISKDS